MARPQPADRELLDPHTELLETLEEDPVPGRGHHDLELLARQGADEVVDLLGSAADARGDEELQDTDRHAGMVHLAPGISSVDQRPSRTISISSRPIVICSSTRTSGEICPWTARQMGPRTTTTGRSARATYALNSPTVWS